LDKQRVALAAPVHRRKQLVIRLAAGDLGGKLAGVLPVEPTQVHPGDPADTIQLGKQRAQRKRAVQLVGPVGSQIARICTASGATPFGLTRRRPDAPRDALPSVRVGWYPARLRAGQRYRSGPGPPPRCQGGSKMCRRCAVAAASPRETTPSLPRMLETCTLAVLGEMNSSAAISLLLRPAVTSLSTSTSRAVSLNGTAAAAGLVPVIGMRVRRASCMICCSSGRAPSCPVSSAARCSRGAAASRSLAAAAAPAARSSAQASG